MRKKKQRLEAVIEEGFTAFLIDFSLLYSQRIQPTL
jgi:hypothetical protein